MLSPPLNIPKWLSENSHLLAPPINNHCVHSAGPNHDMTIMIVGGPNARTDYHINSTPELFYQYKGSMLLRVIDSPRNPAAPEPINNKASPEDASAFRDIPIREGELFLLPGNTPHNPIRFRDTVGIVVELSRPKPGEEGAVDRLRWYCQECRCVVHEMEVGDLAAGLKDAVRGFAGDERRRTCGACGVVCDVVPSGVVQPE